MATLENRISKEELPPWRAFEPGVWTTEIDVRDFIQKNVMPYSGDESFLEKATERTEKLCGKVQSLLQSERGHGGVLSVDTSTVSIIYTPGYIDKDLETIVGLQTDAPLKRSNMPVSGMQITKNSCQDYGYELDTPFEHIFTNYRKTFDQGVFDLCTPQMRMARKVGIITDVPDMNRDHIIGDYRRVALYGVDRLVAQKYEDMKLLEVDEMSENVIREREELIDQICALNEMKEMAQTYGFDISIPAQTAKEAIQWTYFAYLAAITEQRGTMSFGRVSTFLDVYIQRDLSEGRLTESEAQELIDHLVMKLKLVRFLHTKGDDQSFSGEPWITESIGGMSDGRTLVTRTSFRFLHSIENLGSGREPHITVLWSVHLPDPFKRYSAKVSIGTSCIQFLNDDQMRPTYGDDYGIAGYVSAMQIGKHMQFSGGRADLAKALLYAINGGIDEKLKIQAGPRFSPITSENLNYFEVFEHYDEALDWLAKLYMHNLNIIHFMHDKYLYERMEMALNDSVVSRSMECAIVGLSFAVNLLSAIRYANVRVVRDEDGLVADFIIEGDYPRFGNDDYRVDGIAINLVTRFRNMLNKHRIYRGSVPPVCTLTIIPDEPVAKILYSESLGGVSNTFPVVPQVLGNEDEDTVTQLVTLLDGVAVDVGLHLNVNVRS